MVALTLAQQSGLLRLALGGRTDLARVCGEQGVSADTAERIGLLFLLAAEEMRSDDKEAPRH